MDLAETMKHVLSKGGAAAASLSGLGMVSGSMLQQHGHQSVNHQKQSNDAHATGIGYVTEKLYMLLQLYLQNKGWNPTVELLQCFSELKDSSLLPNAAYLQVLANRLALDSQGRLVLRESGKIVLPYEHFANAVMLKHMTGPHGLHLSVEATVRAVVDSYTIGRENFGMEKEFIIEVVQSCPNPACRFYKTHLGAPFIDSAAYSPQLANQLNQEFLQHMQQSPHGSQQQPPPPQLPPPPQPPPIPQSSIIPSTGPHGTNPIDLMFDPATAKQAQIANQRQQEKLAKALQSQQQHQITAAIIQQQNRAIAQQNLEKFGNMSALEKQRVLQQLDKKHYEAQLVNLNNAAVAAAAAASVMSSPAPTTPSPHHHIQSLPDHRSMIHDRSTPLPNIVQTMPQHHLPPPPSPAPSMVSQSHASSSGTITTGPSNSLDGLDPISANKDLLALHNGAWGSQQQQQQQQLQQQQQQQQQHHHPVPVQIQSQPITHQPHQSLSNPIQISTDGGGSSIGQIGNASVSPRIENISPANQDKIIRAFGELMRNMARMKTFIRPSMCKPYGKQSESLQKTLADTILLVQSLRGCLPAPHIPVSSWKSEDRLESDAEFKILDLSAERSRPSNFSNIKLPYLYEKFIQ